VILVYALAQLVAQIAFLPGGGGTVELSLAAGFAAFGHHSGAVLTGALLYRVLGCWGLVPIGWLGFTLDPARTTSARCGHLSDCVAGDAATAYMSPT
jgi:hypothetical protein